MTCGIYLIQHLPSGRGYVGQSVNIESRFRDHRAGKGSRKLSAALRKYGAGAFEFKILLECSREELSPKEVAFIEQLDTLHPNGFNLTDGGKQPGKMSPETHQRFSEAGKRRMECEAHRTSLDRARKASWGTEGRKAQQSNLMSSLANSEEWKARSSARAKALAENPEVNAKRSAALKRYHQQRREGVAA